MSRYRPLWLEIAEQRYRNLPDDVRDLVDRRLAQLFENPTTDPDAVYNKPTDQWSITLGVTASCSSPWSGTRPR